ncbi:MAG: hypothetical protein U0894_17945 [Pirellulales bacterium]
MNEELETRLRELLPAEGPSPQMRERVLKSLQPVLASVDKGTPQEAKYPAFYWVFNRAASYSGLSAAMLLLVAIGANYLAYQSLDGRMAALAGPPRIDRQVAEVAQTIALATDSQTGEEAYQWLLQRRSRRVSPTSLAHYDDVFQRLLLLRGI